MALHDGGAAPAAVTAATAAAVYGGAAALAALAHSAGILAPATPALGSPNGSGDGGGGCSGNSEDESAAGALTFTREDPWVALKVVTLSAASTALGALTFFNFALALPVTAALVPTCLASAPPPTPTKKSKPAARLAAAGVAVAAAVAPAVIAALGAAAAAVPAAESLGHFAAQHRALDGTGGTFALPVYFGVAIIRQSRQFLLPSQPITTLPPAASAEISQSRLRCPCTSAGPRNVCTFGSSTSVSLRGNQGHDSLNLSDTRPKERV